MEALDQLTPEEKVVLEQVRDYWLNNVMSCTKTVDREKATPMIGWLYEYCGVPAPRVLYVESPPAAQYGQGILKFLFEGSNPKGFQLLKSEPMPASVDTKHLGVVNAVFEQFSDVIVKNGANTEELQSKLKAITLNYIAANKPAFESFGGYLSISDYGWVSFYDFFTRIGKVANEDFNKFKELLDCGIYDTIQLHDVCVVVSLPSHLRVNADNALHCVDGPAIAFRDGFKLYYINDIQVPELWIENPERIDASTIEGETNIERRRILRQIIGPRRYFELLGGVDELDRDTDHQGNLMVLYSSKKVDEFIQKKIQYLNVVCPSTGREYLLYPPNQDSTNVWEAKASTFNNRKGKYRHGDVMLEEVGKEFERPVAET